MLISSTERRMSPAWRLLAFMAGFGPAVPDLVLGNVGLGLQIAILATAGLAVIIVASSPAVPRRLLRDPLFLLVVVFALSAIPIVAMRGIGADAALGKWARQLATVSVMLLAAFMVARAAGAHPSLNRALVLGFGVGGAFTVLTSIVFLALNVAGGSPLLPHNNLSFVSSPVMLPSVAVRDAESILPRVYGFFTEPSFFSAYAAPVGVFLLARRVLERGRSGIDARWLGAMIGVSLLVLAIFVSSRTGMVAGTFAVLATIFAHRRWLGLLILTSIVATFGAPLVLAVSPLLFAENLASADISVLERTAAAAIGLAQFQANPLFGVGFGAFGFAYNETGDLAVSGVTRLLAVVSDQQNVSTTLPNAFNLVVRLAAETGLVGLLALAAVVISLARTAVRGTPGTRAASIAAITFLVASIDSFVMMQFWLLWALARCSPPTVEDACAS